MRIAVVGLSMSYLSGQPLYCYETCMELKRLGHQVTMVSEFFGPLKGNDGYKLLQNLEKADIKCQPFHDPLPEQDLIIASETISEQILNRQPNTPAIVVVHSEYECETPISDRPQIIKYVCIRYSILEHIVKEHGIPEEKCTVIFNGVDRDRFVPIKKSKRNFYKIVVPCTLDTLREPFLQKMIAEANEKKRVFFYGFDCGAKLDRENPYIEIHPDTFDIEREVADADEVAGILLGRVNLEAWSCGVKSSIYNPVTLESTLHEPPKDFDRRHNIKNVVKDILACVPNLDDISFVVAHYDQREKLKRLLDSLKNAKHIIVSKNGTFAEGNNTGFLAVTTPYVCFLNDDTVVEDQSLILGMKDLLKDYDIIGCQMKNGCNGFDIINGILEERKVGDSIPQYPSGACLVMKSEVYKKLGGFCENFRNGGEDVDFYLRAEKKGYKIGIYTKGYLFHDEASSTGRFDHLSDNIKLLNKKWRGICKNATLSED